MRNRKQKLYITVKQENNSSPQISIYEDRKKRQEWTAAQPRKLIPKCQQMGILAPPDPAKLRPGGVPHWRGKQEANKEGVVEGLHKEWLSPRLPFLDTKQEQTVLLWEMSWWYLHSGVPDKRTAGVKPCEENGRVQ